MNKLEENENYNNQTFEDIKHIERKGLRYREEILDNIEKYVMSHEKRPQCDITT